MAAEDGSCGRCCCSFLFTSGLTALFLWLSLRPSSPTCLLQNINIPALNKTLNSTTNTTIYFELRLENTNKDKGVYYETINVTFFDSPNRSHSLGNTTIPKFYQGHQKKAKKFGEVKTTQEALFQAVSPNGSAVFRVDLATTVRYKIMAWKTKKYGIKVGGNVQINAQGTKTLPPKKGIKLKSNAAKIESFYGQMGVFLVNFLVLFFINF